MSVNAVNKSDGSLSKIAGKVANGELIPSVSYYQSGQKTSDMASWSTGETGTFSINLSENMPDTDYIVVPTLSVVGVSASVHSKTSNSFKVTVRNDREETIAQAITLYWQAFKLMTNEQHALDETAIAQNTSDISDLQDDKQDKTLETPLTIGGASRTTVEGALGGLNGLVPSDAGASNKLMTRRCIRCNNASDLENAIVNLPDYSQLDFAAISEITIGGVTLPQYTAWHIHRDSNGLACIGGVGYSYVDGSCYKIQGSNYPESAGLALTMQKLVTESDLTSSVTSGSTAPITAGGIYSTFQGQYATMNTSIPNYQSGFCKYVSIGAFIVGSGRIHVSEDTQSAEIVSGLPSNSAIIPVLIYSSTHDADLGYARYEAGSIVVNSLKAGHSRFSFCGLLIGE